MISGKFTSSVQLWEAKGFPNDQHWHFTNSSLALCPHQTHLLWLVQNSQSMKEFKGIRSLPLFFFMEREQKVRVNFPCHFFCQITPELYLSGFPHCENSHPKFHKKPIVWGIPKACSYWVTPYSFFWAIQRCKCFIQMFWKKSPTTTENTGKWAEKVRWNVTLAAEFCSLWPIFPLSHSPQIYSFTSFFWKKN